MAKAKKFKSTTGSPVHVYGKHPTPIEVPPGSPYYETSDKDELEALQGSPEVAEVKAKSKNK